MSLVERSRWSSAVSVVAMKHRENELRVQNGASYSNTIARIRQRGASHIGADAPTQGRENELRHQN